MRELKFPGRVNGLAVDPRSRTVAVACDDGLVQAIDLDTGQVFEHREKTAATCVAFSPDGKRLAAGGVEGWVGLWDWRNAQEIYQRPAEASGVARVEALALSSNTFGLAMAETHPDRDPSGLGLEGAVRVMGDKTSNVRALRHKQPLYAERPLYTGVCWLPDGRGVVSMVRSGHVNVYTLRFDGQAIKSSASLYRFVGPSGIGHTVAVDPTGTRLAGAGEGLKPGDLGELKIWDLRPYRLPLTVRGKSSVQDISLSPNGALLDNGVRR